MFRFMAVTAAVTGLLLAGCSETSTRTETAFDKTAAPLYYHIFVRSFADSDGDQIGDLQGIIDSLDYLQSLGVTGLLLTPLYPSQFYHNYFADDFYGIDAEFGDMATYLALVKELHQRGMTLVMDQEIQYVSGNHKWHGEALGNPASGFDGYVLFSDEANQAPVGTLFGRTDFQVWPNQKQTIVTVDMLNPKVRDYFKDYLLFWLDPNGDGDFSDGVDGFRIDHMMDDLDNAGVLTNLFEKFWAPIFDGLRARNPGTVIVAEQYDWGYGEAFLTEGKADMVFSFPIWRAAADLNANKFAEALKRTNDVVTEGKGQFVFIENHDTNRFAGHERNRPRVLKLGAAINLLTGWTPIVYFGQEIGMTGEKAETAEALEALAGSIDDARDIPLRQAFRWHPDYADGTLATWYLKDREAYPLQDSNRPGDGVSVAEQDNVATSLLNTYRRLSKLRQAHSSLANGATEPIANTDNIAVFLRSNGRESTTVAFNFSDVRSEISFNPPGKLETIYGKAEMQTRGNEAVATLEPYGVSVWLNIR